MPKFLTLQHAESKLRSRQSFDRLLQWDVDLPADLVERIWTDPRALLAGGKTLQDKLRCTVARIDHPAGIFTWKSHNWGTLRRTLKKSLSESPARKSWFDSGYLRVAGIPTPRIRAVLEHRFGPLQRCSYLLTDYIVGTSLYRLMRFERPSRELVEHLARQVADIWQQLDDLGVWHNDFKTENFLVDRDGKVWLIDFERMRRFRETQRGQLRERQTKDAADLLHPRNWRSDPGAAEVFRQALLKTRAARQALSGTLAATHPFAKPILAQNRSDQLVTVLISSHNSAESIIGCLESVRDMADEVVVVDFQSTDDTLERVRRFGGCRIIERESATAAGVPRDDTVAYTAWAASQATHPWILRMRSDEQLNGELSRQVQDLLASEPTEDGFQIARTVYLRGRRLRFGTFRSQPSIRLFRKGAARFALAHGRLEVSIPSGRIGHLRSRLVYEACPGIERCLHDMLQVATQAAEHAQRNGRGAAHRSLLWRVPLSFIRSYFWRWGWLDGGPGLHASFLTALSLYLREMAHYELESPDFEQHSLVHDTWQQLKVYAPEQEFADSDATDSQSAAA